MARKGDIQLGFGSIAVILLFAVAAFFSLNVLFRFTPVITQNLQDSICKLNVFFRASTLGNPVVGSMIGAAGMVSGSFGGAAVSQISMPLACSPGPALKYVDHVTPDVVAKKVMDEAVRCWDLFGEGHLDSLLLYEGGNQFTCYQQTLEINCGVGDEENEEWIKAIFKEPLNYYSAIFSDCGEGVLCNAFYRAYASVSNFMIGDVAKKYSDFLGTAFYKGNDGINGFSIKCDGQKRKYVVGVYYIDRFFQAFTRATAPTPTICGTVPVTPDDRLILCTLEVQGVIS